MRLRCRAGAGQAPVQDSSSAAIRPGIWSAACISILPRTGRTRTRRSLPRDLHDAAFGQAKAQHLPLGKALRSIPARGTASAAVAADARPARRRALRLAESHGRCGRNLSPAALESAAGAEFLKDVPALESAGVVVRMPASWRMNRPARPQVKATVGDKAPSQLGMDALLDFRMEVTLDGETLSAAEIKQLRRNSTGWPYPRQVGRGRSRTAGPDARAIRGHRAPRRQRWSVVRRGDAPAGRSRHCR